MSYVIRLVGLLSGEASEDQARYLCRIVDPSGEVGLLSTTPDPAAALRFESPGAAFELWSSARLGDFHAVIEAVTDPVGRLPRQPAPGPERREPVELLDTRRRDSRFAGLRSGDPAGDPPTRGALPRPAARPSR